MALVVQKYGGSSLASPEKIINVAKRIKERREDKNKMVIVVSAMGDSTDDLIELSKKINKKPSDREMDMLMATGEQVSIAMLSMALDSLGVPAVSYTGFQIPIITNDLHSKARIKEINTEKLGKKLEEDIVVIVAGFQGKTEDDEITTLGRGGSDTTAVALGAALEADVCEIFTDVDGVYTTDPRIEEKASKLKQISYDEMLELASLGAGVLHPRSVELAKVYGVPLCVRSSFSKEEGTLVVDRSFLEKEMLVTGVTRDLDVAKIGLFDVMDKPGIASSIFNSLAKANINVDMIVQSAMRNNVNDISFTLPRGDLDKARLVIEEIKEETGCSEVLYVDNVAKISIVGAGMFSSPGVAAAMFDSLAKNGINLHMISTSEIKVSCIIEPDLADEAVKILHKAFNLDELSKDFEKPYL